MKAIIEKITLKTALVVLSLATCSGFGYPTVHPHGYWVGKEEEVLEKHAFDPYLAEALTEFFNHEKALNVVDFGCGPGKYIQVFLDSGIDCSGFDGNPDTPALTSGLAGIIDLSAPFELEQKFDWVMSLEVGEHLPKKFERIFVENLHRHNKNGIVLSWALKGQGGFGHFNEQSNEYVKAMMAEYGYESDLEAEKFLRERAFLPWFKNTIMVFRRK